MKKLFARFFAAGVLLMVIGFAVPALSADAPATASASAEATAAPAATSAPVVATPVAATPAAAPAAPAAAPVPNKGDTAWMMMATVLVILMTIPGLALFYGGLVRSKNML